VMLRNKIFKGMQQASKAMQLSAAEGAPVCRERQAKQKFHLCSRDAPLCCIIIIIYSIGASLSSGGALIIRRRRRHRDCCQLGFVLCQNARRKSLPRQIPADKLCSIKLAGLSRRHKQLRACFKCILCSLSCVCESAVRASKRVSE
jgi:hypothetical protein